MENHFANEHFMLAEVILLSVVAVTINLPEDQEVSSGYLNRK